MRGKSYSPSYSPMKSKLRNYSLKNSPPISNNKDLEKIFDEMKNNIIEQIKKVAESELEKQKEIFFKYINEHKVNQSSQSIENNNDESEKKNNKSKKKIVMPPNINNEVEQKSGNKKSHSQKKRNIKSKSLLSKRDTKKDSKKNLLNFEEGKNVEEDINSINNMNITVLKFPKKVKKENEEKDGENALIGKKKKRDKQSCDMSFNIAPNYDFLEDEKKPKNLKNKGKSKLKKVK